MMVIAIANQKGGVAKTTSSQAIAAVLKRNGHRVLAIDFDPQGNLSDSVGADVKEINATIYEVLAKENIGIKSAIQEMPMFDIAPADIMLANTDLMAQIGKEYLLREAIEPVRGEYDYIIIDSPPSLGLLTINALTAADAVLIPTSDDRFSVKGINELANTVKRIKKYFNPNLTIRGIFFTRYEPRTINAQEMHESVVILGKALGIPVLSTNIRNRVKVKEAQARQLDLLGYSGCEEVVKDYSDLVAEVFGGE